MKLNIEDLQVIEIQITDRKTSFGHTLHALRLLTNAFLPESCARQVMIFFNIRKPDQFERHFQNVEALAEQCSHLKGQEAYMFLLSWIIGGEYRVTKKGSKLPLYNDNHILGKFRQAWASFEQKNLGSPSTSDTSDTSSQELEQENEQLRLSYIRIISSLLEDAHEIRKRIEAKQYGEGIALRAILDKVITNVVHSRMCDFPVLYEAIDPADYKVRVKSEMQSTMLSLQDKMGKVPEDSKPRRAMLSKFHFLSTQVEALDKDLESVRSIYTHQE